MHKPMVSLALSSVATAVSQNDARSPHGDRLNTRRTERLAALQPSETAPVALSGLDTAIGPVNENTTRKSPPLASRVASSPRQQNQKQVQVAHQAEHTNHQEPLPTMAVCLLGQPRAVRHTVPAVRQNLLDEWGADAFVFAHSMEEREPTASEVDYLRALLGPRVITFSYNRGPGQAVVDNTSWAADWDVHGSPLQQWEPRPQCLAAVARQEATRGRTYAVYFRLRFDVMFFRPVALPHALMAQIHDEPCMAVVPTGEDWNGNNDRLIVANRCGFAADADIASFVEQISPRQIEHNWTLEETHAENLAANNVTVRRHTVIQCLLEDRGSCSPTSFHSLDLSVRDASAHLLVDHRTACGTLLDGEQQCDPGRTMLPGGRNLLQDEAMAALDPGWCSLQARCLEPASEAAAARMRLAQAFTSGGARHRRGSVEVGLDC